MPKRGARRVNGRFVKKGSAADLQDQFVSGLNAEEKAAKKAAAPKPVEPEVTIEQAASAKEFESNGDLLDIWQRRMINPDQRMSGAIRIKTAGMKIRWINLTNNGRYQRARYEEGWIPVVKSELVDEREIYGVSYTVEGYVCRGEKSTEMLMKIPMAVWNKIRRRHYELVQKSQRNLKENMQQASASDERIAARSEILRKRGIDASPDSMADAVGNFKGEIKFGTERVEPEPGDMEPATE